MITNELKDLVREEARNLREKAKKEELEKLTELDLDPFCQYRCIYGQITGNCVSSRAKELMIKCCKLVVNSRSRGLGADVSTSRLRFSKINPEDSRYSYWSPIELYIGREGAKNANLIAYLKGETDILEL